MMQHSFKHVADGSALTVAGAAFLHWLPENISTVAGTLSSIYLVLSIFFMVSDRVARMKKNGQPK